MAETKSEVTTPGKGGWICQERAERSSQRQWTQSNLANFGGRLGATLVSSGTASQSTGSRELCRIRERVLFRPRQAKAHGAGRPEEK